MEPKNILELLNDSVGRKWTFETHDGAYRTEIVHHISYREIQWGGLAISYPMQVCFDKQETDFMHLSSLKSVKQAAE